tara:strand:- start:4606 stop:4848 length:243 start_codon:yes stop_codon:yes gene_type:complete
MQHYLETLNAIITDKIVNIEDYYAITLQGGVNFQGKYTSKIVTALKSQVNLQDLRLDIGNGCFVEITFRYNSTIVAITLT